MAVSKFKKDFKEEKWFSSILDKDFYPEFISRLNAKSPNNNYSFRRIEDLNRQFKGIDLIISDNKTCRDFLVDEKAQLSYMNKTLPTFIFELHYYKDGDPKIGWFLDLTKETTYYFFFRHIFISIEKHLKSFIMDSIDRQRFKNYLTNICLNDEFLQEIVDKLNQSIISDNLFIIKENRYGFKVLPDYLNRVITLSVSPQLSEKPINLLVNLDKLKKIEVNLFNQYKYPFSS